MSVLAEYALQLMLKAQPTNNVPWKDTYPATAEAIAEAAAAHPLFKGENGDKRTVSVMVAVADFESKFNPKAVGDCPDKDSNGMCVPGSEPRSFCTFQIHNSNFKFLGVTKMQLLEDTKLCATSGLRMMHKSFETCKGWKPTELLNQYATGGGVCVRPKHDEGEHRMRKAQWLYKWAEDLEKTKKTASN